MQYRRVILKFSGEIFKPISGADSIDYKIVEKLGNIIADLQREKFEIGIVLGGGNIFRGLSASQTIGYDRVNGDYMGMLATVINCLALKDYLDKLDVKSKIYSSLLMSDICEKFTVRSALKDIAKGRVLLLAGGTGSAFFSTDSAAALRANELQADVVIKATKVDGIYDKDPQKYHDAKKFDRISFADVLKYRLNVMDSTAFSLCMDNNIPILVIKVSDNMGNIKKVLYDQNMGTLVSNFN